MTRSKGSRAASPPAAHSPAAHSPVDGAGAPLRRTLTLVSPEYRRLWVTTLIGAGTAACGIALLATSAWLISRAAQRPSVVDLGLAIVGVRFFAVSRAVCRYGERLYGHNTALRVLSDLRVRVYARLERLAPTGLPAFRRGDLLARLVHDVDSLQDLMLRVIPPYGVAVMVAIPTVGLVWYFLPSAGLILALVLILAATAVPWSSLHLARKGEARQASARGDLTAQVVDLAEGAQELVAFGAVDAQLERISAADAELTGIATSTARTAGLGSGLVTFLTGIAVWAILLVGVPSVHSGRLNGPLLAVIALIPLAAFDLVAGLPGAAQSLERVRHSAERVFQVIDAPPAMVDPATPSGLPEPPYHLLVRNVRARYGPGAPLALDGIDLDLSPGRRVGIVGPSGAGKSTLAHVLLRLLPYESGSVTVNGIELSSLSGDDVRRVVGLAGQDPHIFSNTLRENLMLANREASEAEIRMALDGARLAPWVDQLPAGLETEVGGQGTRMSGGQRQRVGIARVLLAGFPVLVLDEPGEHLDTETADAIVADLVDITRGKTTVMITHRLAGLQAMDEILVLDDGRVVERGSHDQLVSAGGSYSRQWKRECDLEEEMGVLR
jgi:thiol reductant ABC exporter CydC subunit